METYRYKTPRQLFFTITALTLVFTLVMATVINARAMGQGLTSPKTAPPHLADPAAWHNPYTDNFGIKMVSPTSGWMVGSEGTIRHYGGSRWDSYPSPTSTDLYAVDATASDGWAVGHAATTIHLVGSDWVNVSNPAPTSTNLSSIALTSSGDAWAVGNTYLIQPVVMHYTAGAWQLATPAIITDGVYLDQISCGTPTDCWLVGQSSTAYHYQNGSWTAVVLPLDGQTIYPTTVFMISAAEGWMGVHNDHDPNIIILHYTGGVWQPTGPLALPAPQSTHSASPTAARPTAKSKPDPGPHPFSHVNQVFALSSGDYYAVGGQTTGEYTTSAFFLHNGSVVTQTLDSFLSLSGSTDSDIWVAGGGNASYHWDGANFNQVSGTDIRGYRVKMLSPSDGWMIGNEEQLYHYDGNSWTMNPTLLLDNVAFASSNDGWGVRYDPLNRNTSFYHYTGTWGGAAQVLSGTVAAMQMLSSSEGWGAGEVISGTGPIVYHYSGGVWSSTVFTADVGVAISSLSFSSPSDGWLAGSQGDTTFTQVLYHYDGSHWQRINAVGGPGTVAAVSALAANNVWVGASTNNTSTIWHWDGSSWTSSAVPLNQISDMQMLSPTEGWAVGTHGALHYQNGSWHPVSLSFDVLSLSFDQATDGWAIGAHGILHYYPACYDYYADVPQGYWAEQSILYLSCHGIVNGTGSHIFSPGAFATRDQFAKMITIARGWLLTTPTTPTFSDVPAAYPFYTYIETAYANGALSGASAQQCQAHGLASPCFLPHDQITRAQIAIITVRAFGWPIDTSGGPHFSDVPTTNYAYAGVETAYHHGVVTGIGGGLFAPNANVNRSQLAAILYRALTNP